MGGSGDDYAISMDIKDNQLIVGGNVLGPFTNGAVNIPSGRRTLLASINTNSGNIEWMKGVGTSFNNRMPRVCIIDSKIFLGGTVNQTSNFSNNSIDGTINVVSGTEDAYLATYNLLDGEYLSIKQFTCSERASVSNIISDQGNNIYLTFG